MSDVYVYADCSGGWTTHTAGNRLAFPPIPEPPFSMVIVRGGEFDKVKRKMVYRRKIDAIIAFVTAQLFIWLSKPHAWSMAIIPRRHIDLPDASGMFSDDTPGECADRLEYLRSAGFRVPQFAIDALRDEQQEMEK